MGRQWIVLCMSLLLLTGCIDQGVPAEKADVIGTVTEVQEQRFLLRAKEDVIRSGDVYAVAITDRTSVYLQKAGKATAAKIEDIQQDQQVSLWVDGRVRESDPPRVSAKVVLIQEEE
ncbi:hypothetical protein [Desmospora activa]|uniref:DUF3221 domain-containing protein n=1 Tax=Desmospora activa DSM 45169 TaxID=1121389 RepID=A0A2T4ZDC5_9BACL|nr:hypothetical protein [Desmospora activa]PTM59876.1 hypothetical protein C8J48_2513 [Desmospora activa DSM 45169]